MDAVLEKLLWSQISRLDANAQFFATKWKKQWVNAAEKRVRISVKIFVMSKISRKEAASAGVSFLGATRSSGASLRYLKFFEVIGREGFYPSLTEISTCHSAKLCNNNRVIWTNISHQFHANPARGSCLPFKTYSCSKHRVEWIVPRNWNGSCHPSCKTSDIQPLLFSCWPSKKCKLRPRLQWRNILWFPHVSHSFPPNLWQSYLNADN